MTLFSTFLLKAAKNY